MLLVINLKYFNLIPALIESKYLKSLKLLHITFLLIAKYYFILMFEKQGLQIPSDLVVCQNI